MQFHFLCNFCQKSNTVSIDKQLLQKALSASGLKSSRATVEEAVKLYIQAKINERNLRGKFQHTGVREEVRISALPKKTRTES